MIHLLVLLVADGAGVPNYKKKGGLPFSFPNSLELSSLSLDSKDDCHISSRKRKKYDYSPISPLNYSHYYNLPKGISLNHYDDEKEVQTANDDYFFYDPENYKVLCSENRPGRFRKKNDVAVTKIEKPIVAYEPERIEDFVVIGSRIIRKEISLNRNPSPPIEQHPTNNINALTTSIISVISSLSPRSSRGERTEPITELHLDTPNIEENDKDQGSMESESDEDTETSFSNLLFDLLNPYYEKFIDGDQLANQDEKGNDDDEYIKNHCSDDDIFPFI